MEKQLGDAEQKAASAISAHEAIETQLLELQTQFADYKNARTSTEAQYTQQSEERAQQLAQKENEWRGLFHLPLHPGRPLNTLLFVH